VADEEGRHIVYLGLPGRGGKWGRTPQANSLPLCSRASDIPRWILMARGHNQLTSFESGWT